MAYKRHSQAATSTSEGSSELCAKAGHEGTAVGDIHEVSLFGPSLRGPLRAYVCPLLHITTLLCIWLRYLLEQTFHTTLNSLQNLGLSSASEIQNCVFLTPSGCFNTASHLPPWPQRSFCLDASKTHGNPPASDSQVPGSKACISSQPVTGYFISKSFKGPHLYHRLFSFTVHSKCSDINQYSHITTRTPLSYRLSHLSPEAGWLIHSILSLVGSEK